MIEIKVDNQAVLTVLSQLRQATADLTPVMRAIAGVLADQTEQNFADQAGPTGKWAPLKDKRRAGGKILQDTGRLAAGVHTRADGHSASIGTNVVYAAIHQLGGTIDKPAQSRLIRHRTDKKGNLLTTPLFGGKGLIFAKNSHKNALARWFEQKAHAVNIPARPFLPVTPAGRLQGGVEAEINQVIARHLGRVMGA